MSKLTQKQKAMVRRCSRLYSKIHTPATLYSFALGFFVSQHVATVCHSTFSMWQITPEEFAELVCREQYYLGE